ncbi:hypothetical protein HS7_14350 [Sulfolobales archaeon HS-7]|nr:hypothetical protein HS7_14350 [Sulfolobales archaeon HS-7]
MKGNIFVILPSLNYDMNMWRIIPFYLARNNCETLDEICRDVNIDENNAKVVLSRLAKEDHITRRGLRTPNGKRIRLYCVSMMRLEEINI